MGDEVKMASRKSEGTERKERKRKSKRESVNKARKGDKKTKGKYNKKEQVDLNEGEETKMARSKMELNLDRRKGD